MSKLLQIRNVPDAVHRRLKSRAAILGMSLSEYLLLEISVAADRPSVKEWRERLARRERSAADIDPTGVLRSERDQR
jgi:hypothetical protein